MTRLALLAKILVSVALLAFLSRKIAWPEVEARLVGASPQFLVLAVLLMIATIFGAAWRWRLLVRGPMPMGVAVQLTFAGMFFGQVLPATVGGDVVRGVLAGRNGLPWDDVVASIVLDRITALLGAVILILTGLPWLVEVAVGDGVPLVWTAMASGGLAIVLVVGLSVDLLPLPVQLGRRAGAALDLVRRVRRGLFSKAGAAALALSLVIHVTTAFIVVLIGRALDAPVTPEAALLIVPLAIMAAAVPISLNGWGIREGVMVTGLALFGVTAGDALLISVLLGLSIVVSVLPGSLTWLALR